MSDSIANSLIEGS